MDLAGLHQLESFAVVELGVGGRGRGLAFLLLQLGYPCVHPVKPIADPLFEGEEKGFKLFEVVEFVLVGDVGE